MPTDLEEGSNTIEEYCEFTLAYAAKGRPTGGGSKAEAKFENTWIGLGKAMTGSVAACACAVKRDQLEPAERCQGFFVILERDGADGFADDDLVLALLSTSSQFLENLGASIHLRALLTDLFLIGKLSKIQGSAGGGASGLLNRTRNDRLSSKGRSSSYRSVTPSWPPNCRSLSHFGFVAHR